MEHQSNWEKQIIARGEIVLIVIGRSSYQNIIPVGIESGCVILPEMPFDYAEERSARGIKF